MLPGPVRDLLDAPGVVSDMFVRTLGGLASDFRPEFDIPDLTGKVAVVTGGNSGIGFHTVQELARKGCKVYMGSRTETLARAALDRLYKEGGIKPGLVKYLKIDLATPKSVKDAAEAFLRHADGRLDILVCNAGVLQEHYKTVSEGGLTMSHSMAANHLGHFVLVQQLLPIMTETVALTRDVRIITVASEMHWFTPFYVNLRTVEGWNYRWDSLPARIQRYGLSKLANILFSAELQRRLRNNPATRQIVSISVHPGEVSSEGGLRVIEENFPWMSWLWVWLISVFALSPLHGSYTSLFAATSIRVRSRPDKYGGAYLYPFDRVGRPSWRARDRKLAEDLWKASEEIAATCLEERKA
ncbi:hypothetical protein FRB94_008993 [Tulasnella sp. JGI-2019a]|nr:hypothetical protein FRB93_003478 [Tulasnella sp. JGI-2019a]KAG9014835.1 hypothetical protein FRB94_008993 [Tulasnella sp. JGI-2019a]KAG9040005.1 hypothetical protein FRB95_004477 [Tulasnella sp. JGI-2019a]